MKRLILVMLAIIFFLFTGKSLAEIVPEESSSSSSNNINITLNYHKHIQEESKPLKRNTLLDQPLLVLTDTEVPFDYGKVAMQYSLIALGITMLASLGFAIFAPSLYFTF